MTIYKTINPNHGLDGVEPAAVQQGIESAATEADIAKKINPGDGTGLEGPSREIYGQINPSR